MVGGGGVTFSHRAPEGLRRKVLLRQVWKGGGLLVESKPAL